jgi:hypothetical protein
MFLIATGHSAAQSPRMGEIRNAYKILVGKSEGNRPVGGLGCRWEDNIRMDLKDIGWEVVDWMHLDQDRNQWWDVVNTVVNFPVP